MKYLNIFLLLVLLVCSNKAIAGSTQTNVSGSNTAIEGNYSYESSKSDPMKFNSIELKEYRFCHK